jgi:hypothetical protein
MVLSERQTKNCELCLTICAWAFQLLIWGYIVLVIIRAHTFSNYWGAIILFIIIYVPYIVFALYSRPYEYLCNVEQENYLADYIKQLMLSPIKVCYNVVCFHHTGTSKNRKKITTRDSIEPFDYYSWRDISGTFSLTNERGSCLYYVKLHLGCDVQFADTMTNVDFDNMKEALINQYSTTDKYCDVIPKVTMEGLHEFKLIKIRDSEPPLIGTGWYMMFTCLCVVELYKLYFDLFCETKDFDITKVISTRNNLNIENRFEEPRIVVLGDTYVIRQDNLVGDKAPELPTSREIEQSNTYKSKLSRSGTIGLDLSTPALADRGYGDEYETIPFNNNRV